MNSENPSKGAMGAFDSETRITPFFFVDVGYGRLLSRCSFLTAAAAASDK